MSGRPPVSVSTATANSLDGTAPWHDSLSPTVPRQHCKTTAVSNHSTCDFQMRPLVHLTLCLLPLACNQVAPPSVEAPAEQVRRAESAFARTMADRDLNSFLGFLTEESVFVGDRSTLRGVDAIRAGWAPFFDGDRAPFSWAPETVEVLDSGEIALSSGPVLDSAGVRIGTFNSVWRRAADGTWKVVFDKGCPPCPCDPEP